MDDVEYFNKCVKLSENIPTYINALDRNEFATINHGRRVDFLCLERHKKKIYLLETVCKNIRFAISEEYSYVNDIFNELEASL